MAARKMMAAKGEGVYWQKAEVAESLKRSQPSAAPTWEWRTPVGAAEGCDLLILFGIKRRQATVAHRILNPLGNRN
jgi:hypothetical protein